MTEHEERIEALVNTVPRVQRSFWQKVWRIVGNIAVVVSFAAFALAGFAGLRAVNIADCTNQNLGARNAPNIADRQAIDAAFKTQQKDLLILVSPAATRLAKATAFSDFVASYATYAATRAADDKLRAAHPIGKC